MSESRDFDIKQLHENIQSCFSMLDKRIYRAMNIAPIKNKYINVQFKKRNRAQEYENLQHHVRQLQQKYDELCFKYMQLITKYQKIKMTLKLQQEELQHQEILIKEFKFKQLQVPDVIQIPVYQYLKEFTKNNHSQFSNFLQTILYKKQVNISMMDLLQNIQKYYKPQINKLQIDKCVYPKYPLKKLHERILQTLPDQSISQSQIPERSISFY